MTGLRKNQSIDKLKEELMQYLGMHDPRALAIIRKIKRIGTQRGDNRLIGYAYYRFAYYYYFCEYDLSQFRKYLPPAIRYLLRSDDKEFLGGAYNLVAYDAIDQGRYDIAYAFYMIAVQTAEQVSGIALPGLLEANAGRLLVEMGEYQKGRQQLRHAARRMQSFTSMHTYHYNMALTYAEVALASFLLEDLPGVEKALQQIEGFFAQANADEKKLSRAYFLLSDMYQALLTGQEKKLNTCLTKLRDSWKKQEGDELVGLIFELESLCDYMFAHGYIRQAGQLLSTAHSLEQSENRTVALRFLTLQSSLYEKNNNRAGLRRALLAQHEIRKKSKAESIRLRQYTIEFADMIEEITNEREHAWEEHSQLEIRVHTDALTGLPNRNAINKRLAEEFEKARKNGTRFGIGILDVDGFKQYNDRYGHQAGDACLEKIGTILLSYSDDARLFCARYGGDEFLVGYFDLSEEEIRRIAADMRERVLRETAHEHSSVKEQIDISQGIHNAVPEAGEHFWDYVSLADQDLYRIKRRD